MTPTRAIEPKLLSTASLRVHEPRSPEYQAWIIARLGELAAMLGEPMDSRGLRQSLMAKELSDLPAESLDYALAAWRRGEKGHLSSYEQDRSRIGVFFPKPAELREIAEQHAREQRRLARDQARRDREEAERRDRQEHPENYVHWNPAEALENLGAKKRIDAPEILPPKKSPVCCPHCKQALPFTAEGLGMLRPEDLRALADALERNTRV